MNGFFLLKKPKDVPIGKLSNDAMHRYMMLARHLAFLGKIEKAEEILIKLSFESKNIRKFISWCKRESKNEENKNIVRIFQGKIGINCLQ